MFYAGFTKADPSNLTTDFGVYGVKGVMNGAAIIFFAYLGYDAVATLAEEVRSMINNISLHGGSLLTCAGGKTHDRS